MIPARLEKAAIVLTPVLALATVALGLHVGASARIRGAKVYSASPGAGRGGLALQLETLVEEGGVTEVVPVPGMTVVASAQGKEARWHGASNIEGIAKPWLDLPALHGGDAVTLSVSADDSTDLASGTFNVPAPVSPPASSDARIPSMQKTGDLTLDVYVYGAKLVPGASESVLVHVHDAKSSLGVDGVILATEAEPGLSVDRPFAPTSLGGWSEARVTAEFLSIAQWRVSAAAPAPSGLSGTWFGDLPVAAGGATATLPLNVLEGAPVAVDFVVPPASPRLYVEIDDATGRDFVAVLDVTRAREGGLAKAEVPALSAGIYWLVTSPNARGAESMAGATLARPFRVGPPSNDPPLLDLAKLVQLLPPPIPSNPILDGLRAPRVRAGFARRRGLRVALGALSVAMLLELLLILRAWARSKRRLAEMSDAVAFAGLEKPRGAPSMVVDVAVLLLATLLGFALLAALLMVRAGG